MTTIKNNNSVLTIIFVYIFTFIFLSGIPNYAYLMLDGLMPMYYYLFPLLLMIIRLIHKRDLSNKIIKNPVVIWFIIYSFSGIIWLFFNEGSIFSLDRAIRLRFLESIIVISSIYFFQKINLDLMKWPIFIFLLFAIGTNWYHFLNPTFFTPTDSEFYNPGRASGFFLNPNVAAEAILIMGILIISIIKKWKLLIFALIFIGIFPAFSRAAYIAFIFLLFSFLALKQLKIKELIILLLSPLVLKLIVYLINLGFQNNTFNEDNVLNRLDFLTFNRTSSDASTEDRFYVAKFAIENFLNSPLIGNGVGYGNRWGYDVSTHNMYLLFLLEQGLIGLFMYLSFLYIFFIKGLRSFYKSFDERQKRWAVGLLLFLVFILIESFFSHNLLDSPAEIFAFAFFSSSTFFFRNKLIEK